MPTIPAGETQLWDIINDLRRRIFNLEVARPLEAATVERGGVTVTKGGSIRVVDVDGTVIAVIGALPAAYNRIDGSSQPGVIFYREDGSKAAFLGDLNPLVPPYKQSFQMMDRAGNVWAADDTNGGQGVALPYLSMGPAQSNAAPTDTTTSATFTTVQTWTGYWMSPRLFSQIIVRASDGTTAGEARITDANGVQIGSTVTIAAGAFAFANIGPAAIPGTFGTGISLNYQVRRTAGAGTIGLTCISAIGVQS